MNMLLQTPVRIAAVGAGYFSHFHFDGWKRIEGACVEALAVRNTERARPVAEQHGIPKVYGDVERMLDEVKPDVIDIISPPESHLEYVRLAAERGITIICQKPLAPNITEARELVETAEKAGVPLAIHENFRFMPWYQEAKRLLNAGGFGTLHTITFRMRPGDGQGREAYMKRTPYFQHMKRFLIHETGIHFIDTFRFLMGEVTRVFAWLKQRNPIIKGEDGGYVLFDFENGASGLYDANRLNDHVTDYDLRTMGEMWIEGSDGVLRLDGWGRLWWRPHHGEEVEHTYDWNNENFGGDCTYATERHIFSNFTEGTPLQNSGRDYLRNFEIEEAIYRSNKEGCWIEV